MCQPEKFVVVNEPVESALRAFGYEVEPGPGITGRGYRQFLWRGWQVRRAIAGGPAGNPEPVGRYAGQFLDGRRSGSGGEKGLHGRVLRDDHLPQKQRVALRIRAAHPRRIQPGSSLELCGPGNRFARWNVAAHRPPDTPHAGANHWRLPVGFMFRELSAGVRKSETVALPHPVMPVGNGFGGRVVGINSRQL